MYSLWINVMKACGYSFKEFLLSPETALNIPNARKRYYFIAKHENTGSEVGIRDEEGKDVTDVEESVRVNEKGVTLLGENPTDSQDKEEERLESIEKMMNIHNAKEPEKGDIELEKQEADANEEELEETEENPSTTIIPSSVITELPQQVKQKFIVRPVTLSSVSCSEPLSIDEIIQTRVSREEQQSYNTMKSLKVPLTILQSSWAKKHLSIVSSSSKLSYCFTKGYGKIYDHSAGSCYLIPSSACSSSSSLKEKEIFTEKLDREDLGKYVGKIRLFHPNELLAIFGFPDSYDFPSFSASTSASASSSSTGSSSSSAAIVSTLQQQYGCIGNSINVKVVQAVMHCLFEDASSW
jgi:site-specific DNA-cytosine methylase